MSRSHRKHPYRGITTCDSEKEDKRRAHRRWRAAVRVQLAQAKAMRRGEETLDLPPLPLWREFADPWTWGKDGKWWIDRDHPWYARLMRK